MEKKLRITVDGRAYNVTVEDLSEGYGLPSVATMPSGSFPAANAPAIVTAPAAVAAPKAASAAAGAGDVVATLGGTVNAVPVAVGQDVRQGDPVVVVEAMKMNSPMVAPRSGKVLAVHVKPGEIVETGKVLATIG
jgi:glutaconyl-CoA/methylmalonyl-CoA decarboxylase subunit gamma